MTTDPTRAPALQAAADAVQQLRTAWLQMQRTVQIINDHALLATAAERDTCVSQIKAAQGLIHGAGEAVGREAARIALTTAEDPDGINPGMFAELQ